MQTHICICMHACLVIADESFCNRGCIPFPLKFESQHWELPISHQPEYSGYHQKHCNFDLANHRPWLLAVWPTLAHHLTGKPMAPALISSRQSSKKQNCQEQAPSFHKSEVHMSWWLVVQLAIALIDWVTHINIHMYAHAQFRTSDSIFQLLVLALDLVGELHRLQLSRVRSRSVLDTQLPMLWLKTGMQPM